MVSDGYFSLSSGLWRNRDGTWPCTASVERVAQSITNDYQKASALANVAGTLAATDPDG